MSCGIYAIVNKVNGKRYIGKSINIEMRWSNHLSNLRRNTRSKDTNRKLYSAFKKYGESNFGFEYVEILDKDDSILSSRELYWIEELKTDKHQFGYNLRKDSETKCIVSEETRLLLSENNKGKGNPNYGNSWSDEQKKRASEMTSKNHEEGKYSSEETRRKHSEWSSSFWRDNPDIKIIMAKKVSEATTRFKIVQCDRQGNIIKVWDSMRELSEANPDYFRIAIYNCCNGYKKSYRGFIWKKLSKI
jgi:group I intron endonuclease